MNRRFLHDHDEELGAYWYDDSPQNPHASASALDATLDCLRRRDRDDPYWIGTGRLVREYLTLQAGTDYSEALREAFVAWLKRSPAERRRYVDGDDMQRAALVDWYLKIVR